MELFTFGNLLTIIILAVILALYRLLDKRNRNWDAANKYGKQLKDALKEELGEYIDKKKADIYNYGAILDAEKFSARAVLANIEEKEGELSKQSERYDKISEKLNAYDASLGELLRMTERVETNLFRIQQESGFVENVAVQIDDAKENLAALSAKIVAMSGKIEGDVEHSIKDTLVKIDGILEGARDKAQERVRLWLHKLESELCEGFRSETDNRIKALKQDLEEQIADMAGDVSRKEAQNKNIAELIAQAEQLDAEFHLRLEDSADSVKNEIGRFEAEIAGSRAKIAEDCNAALQGITTNIAEIESAIEKIKEETQEKTGENLKLFEDEFMATLEKRRESIGVQLNAWRDEMNGKLNGIGENQEAELRKLEAGFAENLRRHITELDDKFRVELEHLSGTAEAFETSIGTQLKITEENIASSKEQIQNEFNELRESSLESLGTEIARISVESADKIKKFIRDFEKEHGAMKEHILEKNEEIERLLLKSRGNIEESSGNVAALKASIDEINAGMEKQRSAILLDTEEKIKKLELMLQAAEGKVQRDLEKEHGAMKEHILEKNEEIERLLLKSRGDIEESNGNVAALKASIDEINAGMEKQRSAILLDTEEKIKKLELMLQAAEGKVQRDLEKEHGAMKEHILEKNEEIERLLLKSRGDIEESNGNVAALKASIDEINAGMEKQRSAIMFDTEEKIKKLELMLQAAEGKVQRDLEKEHGAIKEHILEKNEEIERLLLKSRGDIEESSGNVAALKTSIDEINAGIEKQRSAIMLDTEEKIKKLESTLQAAEGKVQEFFSQTKLVDKTIEMKNALQHQIEDIQSDLGRLELQKGDIANIERQLSGVKRLEDEVNVKMSRFLGEQRRIELMEEDFNKLLQTSRSVEDKLSSLTENGDALQEMQLKFRKLSESMAETEEKYQRIEKKNQILDETSESIDKNFKQLQESEKTAHQFVATVNHLSGELVELKAAMDNLVKDNAKIMEAADKVSSLDTMILEIETRLENMQTVREWCTSLEARLLELNQHAHDEVKRAGELLKKESNKTFAEQGAPPLSVREDVIKLKRIGWKTDDIARSLKLAKSAVELILETPPKDM